MIVLSSRGCDSSCSGDLRLNGFEVRERVGALLVVVCDTDVGVFRDPLPYFLKEVTAKSSGWKARVCFFEFLGPIARLVEFVYKSKKVRAAGSYKR
jgi:hypothetical protein